MDEITEEDDHIEHEEEEMIEVPEQIEGEEIQMVFTDDQPFKENQRLSFIEQNNDRVAEGVQMDQTVEQISTILPLGQKDTFDDKDDLFLMDEIQYSSHKRSHSMLRKSVAKRKTFARQPSTSFKIKM